MQVLNRIVKSIGAIFLIPVMYLLVSFILLMIPVNDKKDHSEKNNSIFLQSNGVHLSIIIAKNQLHPSLLEGLKYLDNDTFFAFGWGDKNFYLTTPNWSDLTANNAFRALFVKSNALIHLSRYSNTKEDWVEIKVNQNQLSKINHYIDKTFFLDTLNNKIVLNNKGYSHNDDFYEAVGSFTCFNTCNTWVNSAFKESSIKAFWWTPFDFGLLNMHDN